MNRLKGFTEDYFIMSLAKFCVANNIKDTKVILKIEIIWQYVFLDWGDDFLEYVDAYGDYQWRIKEIF